MNLRKTNVDASSYECTISVDCAVFGFQENQLQVLLVKRAIDPFKDHWMLPGGIMDEGFTVEDSVKSVLFSLTGLDNVIYEQVRVYSAVDRHPVKRVVTVSFYALIKPDNHPVIPKNYVSDVAWFPIKDLPTLGFDHTEIVTAAFDKLRINLEQKLVFGELLPGRFTLKELQDLYENILGEALDRRNFRKRILQKGLIKATDEKKQGVQGGPLLYEMNN